jgi:hypothetical protein
VNIFGDEDCNKAEIKPARTMLYKIERVIERIGVGQWRINVARTQQRKRELGKRTKYSQWLAFIALSAVEVMHWRYASLD